MNNNRDEIFVKPRRDESQDFHCYSVMSSCNVSKFIYNTFLRNKRERGRERDHVIIYKKYRTVTNTVVLLAIHLTL